MVFKRRTNERSHAKVHSGGIDAVNATAALPPEHSDAALEKQVSSLLAKDGMMDAIDVVVTVADGCATLHGSVMYDEEKERAAFCALSVPGVTEVRNEIRVRNVPLEAG